ncbi:hypothetical protein BIW11_09012 [Tropilaelaps mercedesae]|uniref:Uncharacterized protein n=1 Tax=Tropilaelaps mercedesae TaxID=418985 RepID=A0A1V9XLZ0_9ACAR|nr:hypothetical protein BIW11_09012 [Tropilaelaps mercedesae]
MRSVSSRIECNGQPPVSSVTEWQTICSHLGSSLAEVYGKQNRSDALKAPYTDVLRSYSPLKEAITSPRCEGLKCSAG